MARVETWYKRRLANLANNIAKMAKQYDLATGEGVAGFANSLFSYAEEIESWAETVAGVMLRRTAEADYTAWKSQSERLGKGLVKELRHEAIQPTYELLQASQVHLIKSLPLEASQQVHEWAKESLAEGGNYTELAERIYTRLGDVTKSRAILIARTECSRAQTSFTQARAMRCGSTHFIWRTVGDGTVRERHQHLDGQVFRWDAPPIAEQSRGLPVRCLPGSVWNCRCWAEPVIT